MTAMDKELLQPSVKKKKKQGQTLAEFAVTLPLLLILIFGIIEFGRLFQSWVTLQNAARRAVRFASTGDYDRTFFTEVDALVGCATGEELGAQQSVGTGDPVVMYDGGAESLFATVYGGRNCRPDLVRLDEDGQGTEGEDGYLRRDILRIASIQMEARAGLAGLSLLPSEFENSEAYLEETWRTLWNHRPDLGLPSAESQEPRWLNVTVCSSRPFIDQGSNGGGGSTPHDFTEWGEARVFLDSTNNMCYLNEVPSAEALAADAPNNGGAPWADAGGPGNTVTVVVTYNHPLVTPLGFAEYVPISATRAAVVESFRSAQAVDALQGGPSLTTGFPTSTPSNTPPPSATPQPTFTPSATFTASPSPTASATEAFNCALLSITEPRFSGQRVYISIENLNPQPASLKSVNLVWKDTEPGVTMSVMAINSQVHWQGADTSSPTQTNAEGTFIPDDRPVVPGVDNVAPGLDTSLWEGVFTNLPFALLSDYMRATDLGGTTMTFVGEGTTEDCVKSLDIPPAPEEPPPDPNSPTPTYTPDCAGTAVRIRFQEFLPFGVVRISIQNTRSAIAQFTAFDINWRKVNPSLRLADVRIGGTSPTDPTGTTIWTSNAFDQDANPRTKGGAGNNLSTVITGPYEGLWQLAGAYNIPPNSTVSLWINFDGTGSRLNEIGMAPPDFNGTQFEISCGRRDGGSGSGGSGNIPAGVIRIDEIPTPAPTNTRGPTNTPRPTYTPSKTFTPGPPTRTFTPAPPTRTFTPAPATNTQRPTDIPIPTSSDSGNLD